MDYELFPVIVFTVLVLLVFLGIITYYLARVLREVAEDLKSARPVIDNMQEITERVVHEQDMVDDILGRAQNVVGEVESGVKTVKEQVLTPMTYISAVVDGFKQYFDNRGK